MNKKLLIISVLMILLISFVSADLTTDLTAYYTYDSDATDSVASCDGSVTGATHSNTGGIIGGYYSFDADTEQIEMSCAGLKAISGSFSFSLWFRTATNTASQPDDYATLINRGTWAVGSWALRFDTRSGSPSIVFDIYDADGDEGANGIRKTYAGTTIPALEDDAWHHLIGVNDETANTVSIYLDGVLIAQNTDVATGFPSDTESTTIGRNAVLAREFQGKIDEPAIYNRALDDDSCVIDATCGGEIADLYNSGSGLQYPFIASSNFKVTNTNSINNMTLNMAWTPTNYVTTNGTIDIGFSSELETDLEVEANEGHYFNVTRTSYNISNDLEVTFLEYPRVIIHNLYDTQALTGFNVSYDTITIADIAGTAYIPLNQSKSITISKAGFFPQTLTHDFTDQNDLNTSLFQSEINVSLREEITNNTINNWELYQDATKIAESTGDSVIKYFSAGTYSNLTMKSKTASFSDRAVDNITITALDNRTEYIYIFLSDLNITAYSEITSNPIMNFTINLSSYNHTDSRSLSTTTGGIIIPVILTDIYNVSIDAYGYALFEYYDDIYINESPKHYNFSLYTNNSISFTLKDEETNALIIETLFITLTGDNISYSYNTSTGSKYIDEIRDGNYSVKIWNANYDAKYYTITVADRSHQTLTAYLSTDYETAIFTFKDTINSALLEGVYFTQSRVVNGTWTVVATKYSDITGRLPTSYVADTAYKITLVKAGYESKIFTLDPFLFSTYDVFMNRETSLSDIPESDIAVVIDPKIFYEGINNLSVTFISPYGSLNSYWVNVTYPSSNTYSSGNDSQGEILSLPINITSSDLFEQVKIIYYYETSLGFNRTQTFVYSIIPADAYAGTFSQNLLSGYGLGLFERIAIAVLATIIIAGFVYALAGIAGALVVALIVLGGASMLGFIPLSALLITFLIGFILIVSMKWGQS